MNKQLTLFGEQLKDGLDGYSPKRKEVKEHNQRCENGKCPICNRELKIWYSLGGREILGCSSISCNYRGVDVEHTCLS